MHTQFASSRHHASQKIAHRARIERTQAYLTVRRQLPTGSFDDPYTYCGPELGENGVSVERTKMLYGMVAFLG